MTNHRDDRNYAKGYQSAMVDIADAYARGGEDEILEWVKNNLIQKEVTE